MQHEMRTPIAGEAIGVQEVSLRGQDGGYHSAKQCEVQLPGGALAALRFARRSLVDARFRLDDAGLSCPALDRLADDAMHLASRWQGRGGRPAEVPNYIVDAAIDYRRQRGPVARARR